MRYRRRSITLRDVTAAGQNAKRTIVSASSRVCPARVYASAMIAAIALAYEKTAIMPSPLKRM